MVAKGFDFSGLSLVAVLQADSLLAQQDYRADERALQLLEQFRGRSGRRNKKGLFVIQTSRPDHPVYKALSGEEDPDSSTSRLLSERKLFGHPPYSRVVNVVAKDYNPKRLEYMSASLADYIRQSGLEGKVTLTGPYAPAVEMVAREHIRIIRILLPKDRFLKDNKKRLCEAVERFSSERKYTGRFALDVDPV